MPLAAAADLIKNAKKVVVVSGSGISAAAGLSTYVGGRDGLYEKARALEAAKYMVERVAAQEESGGERRSPWLAEAHVTVA